MKTIQRMLLTALLSGFMMSFVWLAVTAVPTYANSSNQTNAIYEPQNRGSGNNWQNNLTIAPLFFDDFDSYPEDSYPPTFIQLYNGTGDANPKIVTTIGYDDANTKVFRLQGSSSWASEHYRSWDSPLPATLVIDGLIKPVSGAWPSRLGLRNPSGSWGARVSAVSFESAGAIYAIQNGDDSNKLQIGTYTMEEWYRVTLVHDIAAKKYSVYLDGALVAADINMHPTLEPTQLLHLTAGNTGTNEIYFDQVGVYDAVPQFTNLLYAAPEAEGSGDCYSWANACTLQTALADADPGDEIWVRAGVHYPGADRADSFILKNDVAIYGGFAGSETALDERDWLTNLTVLSGDIDQNDLTDPTGVVTDTANIVGDNAYHVVVSGGVTETAVLDGFTITGGQADGPAPHNLGAGLYNHNGSPTLLNLAFNANQSGSHGGGLYTQNGAIELENGRFVNNFSGGSGGGLYNSGGLLSLNGAVFAGNRTGGGFTGGGGLSTDNSDPILTNVIFRGNQGSYGGGGVFIGSGNPTFNNALLSGNTAEYGGGIYILNGSPIFHNVTASGNRAVWGGGALYRSGGAATLVNAIFWGNAASYDAQISESGVTVAHSIVQGGYTGVGNLDADPLFVAPMHASLSPITGGDYHLRYASPAIDLGDNSAVAQATDLDGNPRLVDGGGDGVAVVDPGAYEYQSGGFCPPGGVLYVDQAATGANNGYSWLDAYTDLQTALINARNCEVWVAQGVYYPTADANDRSVAFLLRSGVELYGGFNGAENQLAERDWLTNLTALSGDIDQNDLTDPTGVVTDTAHIVGDNAYHIVVGSGVTETAVLDGFIITGGQANGDVAPLNRGGGLYAYNSRVTLANLTFSANQSGDVGGGLYNYLGQLTSANLTFNANQSGSHGGGLYTQNGAIELENGRFVNNFSGGSGGGLYNSGGLLSLNGAVFENNRTGGGFTGGGGLSTDNSDPVLTNVILRGNQGGYGGGGVFIGSGNPTFNNAILSGNTAEYGGGIYVLNGSPVFHNVTASGNRAVWGGGGLYRSGGAATLVNAIFWGNAASYDAQISESGVTVAHSIVQGGYAGVGNLDADPLFTAPIHASLAPTTDGAYRLGYASPAIDSGHTLSVTAPTDLDGLPRLVGAEIDRGGYEWQNYTLAVSQVGAGAVDMTPDWAGYTYLDQVVLTAAAASGWTFVGWSGAVTTGDNPLSLTIFGHTAITATFAQETYNLTIDVVGAGAVSRDPDQAAYTYGQAVTLTATADPGWTFTGWSGGSGGGANPLIITITGDLALTAHFNSYRLYLPLIVR